MLTSNDLIEAHRRHGEAAVGINSFQCAIALFWGRNCIIIRCCEATLILPFYDPQAALDNIQLEAISTVAGAGLLALF